MPRRFGDDSRQYTESHPWISFAVDLNRLSCLDWTRLGEALAKSDHIINVALPPPVSQALHQLYVVKGALASAQIEGNSLTEDQAMDQVQGKLHLPPTQEYQAKDFDNIREACEMVTREVGDGRDLRLTPERIKLFNSMVLQGQPIDDDIIPGEVRTHGVVVGSVYAGAPAGDCEFLLEQLCEWLDQMYVDAMSQGLEWQRCVGIIRAVLAHLYLAWIHPFGDGNGRTARLIEFQLLLSAGFPTPACHLLSNYYNKTRALYYQALNETSKGDGYPVWKFLSYAIQGFLEELREQIAVIQDHQLAIAWVNLVNERRLGSQDETNSRRHELLLALTWNGPDEFTSIDKLARLNTDLAALYATRTSKTLTRDINALLKHGLVVLSDDGAGIRPSVEQLFAFLPMRVQIPLTEREMLQTIADSSTSIAEADGNAESEGQNRAPQPAAAG
ncbi:MAG: Fic family protein [Trebonia sp.]